MCLCKIVKKYFQILKPFFLIEHSKAIMLERKGLPNCHHLSIS